MPAHNDPLAGPIPIHRLMDPTKPVDADGHDAVLSCPTPYGLALLRDADIVLVVNIEGTHLRAMKGGDLLGRLANDGGTGEVRFLTLEVDGDGLETTWVAAVLTTLRARPDKFDLISPIEPPDADDFGRAVAVHSLIDPSRPFPPGRLNGMPEREAMGMATLGLPTREAFERLRDAHVVIAVDGVHPAKRVTIKGAQWWAEFRRRMAGGAATVTADVLTVEVDIAADSWEIVWLFHIARMACDPSHPLWGMLD